jgi:hypothetical protein
VPLLREVSEKSGWAGLFAAGCDLYILGLRIGRLGTKRLTLCFKMSVYKSRIM